VNIVTNSNALAEFQNLLLNAIDDVRSMTNNVGNSELKKKIAEYRKQFSEFDYEKADETTVTDLEFREMLPETGTNLENGILTSSGLHIIKGDKNLVPRITQIEKTLGRLEKEL
jgi:hypothetical protein